jgi:pimeloyl-ACP methyl ester carboxylesterase
MASRELQLTLADVRRYLENRDGVAVRIRKLLEDAIVDAWSQSERVLLIGHSLGSVLAYDTLWELSRERRHPGRIDHFLTLGSPLATRFIRKSLQGAEHRGPERYPGNIRRWTNISSRGEMVALHPRIKPFFAGIVAMGLVELLEDRSEIYNHFRGATGLDVHKSYGYLNHAEVAGLVGDWIGASD